MVPIVAEEIAEDIGHIIARMYQRSDVDLDQLMNFFEKLFIADHQHMTDNKKDGQQPQQQQQYQRGVKAATTATISTTTEVVVENLSGHVAETLLLPILRELQLREMKAIYVKFLVPRFPGYTFNRIIDLLLDNIAIQHNIIPHLRYQREDDTTMSGHAHDSTIDHHTLFHKESIEVEDSTIALFAG